MLLGASLLMLSACGPQVQKESEATVTEKSNSEAVIETILSRRSVRKYKPEAVNRDTMKVILECGINAPNGQNKQSWAVRVVDNPEFLNGVSEIFKQKNPKAAEDPNFKNMFRNAPTVVFIGNDTSYDCSQIDWRRLLLSGKPHTLYDRYARSCRIPQKTGTSRRIPAALLHCFRISG